MLKLVVATVLVLCALADTRDEFSAFKAKYNKKYASAAEEARRLGIFEANMKKAALLNKANPLARFGANQFADLSAEEFKVRHNSQDLYAKAVAQQKPVASLYSEEDIKGLPSTFDWRSKNAVTAVKDQGQCGSCWSFSTTGNIEGQWAIAKGQLVALSEQQLVSCDTIDQGCNGGLMNSAFDWLLANTKGGIVSEASYPYVSGGGDAPACDSSKTTYAATINGHQDLPHDENQMAAALVKGGPIAIAVDASAWQLYFGGVMTACGGSALDHGVLLVGYDLTASTPYWIIKNSWNAGWGEGGYIWVAKDSDQCWLTHYPVTSIVNATTPPPSPPAPVPKGSFGHISCDDNNCQTGCEQQIWQQGECVSYDGVSFTAVCQSNGLSVTAYYNSLNCTGASQVSVQPVNQCVENDNDFNYYQNVCP